MCATWERNSGANACLITEPEELLQSIAELPPDAPVVEVEARIVDWLERDDRIAIESVPAFFEAKKLDELSEEEAAKPMWSTRSGGVPRWLQSPDEGPHNDWVFAGQLDSTYSFFQRPQASE
jgi:hypothetical protein